MTPAGTSVRVRIRTPWVGWVAVISFLVAALDAAPEQADASEPRVATAPARLDLLADVIEQSGVMTAAPEPGIAPWIAYAGGRLFDALFDWLSPLGEYVGSAGKVFVWIARVLVTLVLAMLSWILVRYGIRKLRAAREGEHPTAVVAELEHLRRERDRERDRDRDREAWRRELDARLASSDVRGALEATWWWLARSVLGEAVRSSWTSGDLLARTGRPSLMEPLRSLERFMYGGAPPSVDEVRALARRLEETLA